MKKKIKPFRQTPRLFCFILALTFIFSAFSIAASATCQLSNLTPVVTTGDSATDIVAAASAQIGKTGAQLGATENWCADFVFSCARLVGIGADVIPSTGSVTALYNGILNAGGQIVTQPQKGDLVFYSPLANTHVAIMSDSINSIHGNVNGNPNGSFHLTSRVTKCKYTEYVGSYQYVFVRPNYSSTPSQPLPAPNAPSVSVNGSSVTVSWNAVPGATGYNVFAEKDGITTQWVSITSTESTISETRNNLADGDYAVYIVAYNDTERAQSDKSYFTIRTKSLTAPEAPSVTVNGSSITVSWPAVSGADGYQVFGGAKNGPMWQWNAVTSTASVITMTYDNLLDGEYAIYIVAYNIDNNTKAQSKTTYFTIQTKPVTYSVTLDADGGTINSGNVTSYTEGVGVTLPTDVTKVGYTFLGWFDGDTKVEVIDTTATGDKSFRAKWAPVDCSIQLYAVLDGVTASKPFYRMTAKYGSSLQTALSLIPADVLELAAYTRDHAFYYVTGSVVGPDAAVDLDVALYVKYKTRTFTVSFDLNDGTGKTFTQTVAYGKTATEPQPPKRPGYQFAGWYTSGRTQFDFTTPITQNITLKASWRAVSAVSDSSSQPTGSTRQDSSDTLPFRDVSKSSWYYNSVKLAWEKRLISGITATQYKPDGTLSVAQAIKLAAVLYQSHTEGSVRLTNGAPHWYDSYVRYAVDNSLLDKAYLSYTDKQMNAPIQRREFVHIFFRAADDLSACNVIADGKIPDVSMTSQYAAEIYTFYRAGILSGSDSAGTFYPESNIRRSEVAAILVRLFDSSARLKLSLS